MSLSDISKTPEWTTAFLPSMESLSTADISYATYGSNNNNNFNNYANCYDDSYAAEEEEVSAFGRYFQNYNHQNNNAHNRNMSFDEEAHLRHTPPVPEAPPNIIPKIEKENDQYVKIGDDSMSLSEMSSIAMEANSINENSNMNNNQNRGRTEAIFPPPPPPVCAHRRSSTPQNNNNNNNIKNWERSVKQKVSENKTAQKENNNPPHHNNVSVRSKCSPIRSISPHRQQSTNNNNNNQNSKNAISRGNKNEQKKEVNVITYSIREPPKTTKINNNNRIERSGSRSRVNNTNSNKKEKRSPSAGQGVKTSAVFFKKTKE